MKWLLVAALIALSGCTVRVMGDASMLKKFDRPAETWSVETSDAPKTATPTAEGKK